MTREEEAKDDEGEKEAALEGETPGMVDDTDRGGGRGDNLCDERPRGQDQGVSVRDS